MYRHLSFARAGNWGATVLLLGCCAHTLAFDHVAPITDSAEKYRMSRNPNHTAAFDSLGNLHVTFWSGQEQAQPSTPSKIYHQVLPTGAFWQPPVVVDTPTGSGAFHGARHPSLAILSDDSVHIVWHDHRHSTTANGYIDNIEIYYDHADDVRDFASPDIRLTQTSTPSSNGDNGYTPRILALPDDTLAVLWYDFTANVSVSDLYVKYFTPASVTTSTDLAALRLTNLDNRGQATAYSVPDMTVDASGSLFATWGSEFDVPSSVYYSSIPRPASIVTEQEILTGTNAYFDPPRITTAPNGDVWIVYTTVNGTDDDILAVRKPAASGAFDTPLLLLANTSIDQSQPDLEIDDNGVLHLAWVDKRSGTHVYYGTFDSGSGVLIAEERVTTESATWRSPAIVLDETNDPTLIFERSVDFDTGDIWYAGRGPLAAADHWKNFP